MSDLETITYTERGKYAAAGEHADPATGLRLFICPDWTSIPGQTPRKVTCKRRGCPRCGPSWARDWYRVNSLNLDHYGGAVVMVTITAPGEDRLPWDAEHCAHRRQHRHRGPSGCRVQERAAREWADTLTWRWQKLRGAARLATQRDLKDELGLGPAPAILERAYEPQKRGVPHLHVILGYRTEDEKDAAHVFVGHLKRLAGEYDFGFADGRGKKSRGARPTITRHGVELRPMAGEDAARYLANYLTGRNPKKKGTIRENISDPVMPRSLLWLTPALTSTSTSERVQAMRDRLGIRRGTGITMRLLRKARHVWAAFEGRCQLPDWGRSEDAVEVISVFLQAFRKRPPPLDLGPAMKTARDAERYAIRRGLFPVYKSQLTDFAIQLVENCMPPAEAAAA